MGHSPRKPPRNPLEQLEQRAEAEANAEQRAIEEVLYQEKVEQYKAIRAALKSVRNPKPIAQQIEELRLECRLTVEELAEAIDVQPRSVYRHLKGTPPRHKQLRAYEKIFSEKLGRKVVFDLTS